MRLSDIKGERTLDVIAEIIDPITVIAGDKNAKALFKREKLPAGMSAQQFLLARAKKHVPPLLKSCKGEIIAILAAIEGVRPKKYAEDLSLAKLMKDCYDLVTDSAFIELFTSAQNGGSSGSAQENIVEFAAL